MNRPITSNNSRLSNATPPKKMFAFRTASNVLAKEAPPALQPSTEIQLDDRMKTWKHPFLRNKKKAAHSVKKDAAPKSDTQTKAEPEVAYPDSFDPWFKDSENLPVPSSVEFDNDDDSVTSTVSSDSEFDCVADILPDTDIPWAFAIPVASVLKQNEGVLSTAIQNENPIVPDQIISNSDVELIQEFDRP